MQQQKCACLHAGGFNPQFFPKLDGIMSLFSRVVTAASLWVHLLAINLFSARTILQEGSPGYLLLQKFCMMCLQNGFPVPHAYLASRVNGLTCRVQHAVHVCVLADQR